MSHAEIFWGEILFHSPASTAVISKYVKCLQKHTYTRQEHFSSTWSKEDTECPVQRIPNLYFGDWAEFKFVSINAQVGHTFYNGS